MKYILAILISVFMVVSTAQAASNVTFAWDTSYGATGYKVYQSTVPGIYGQPAVCETPNLTCTVNNIPDGTYYWVATAYDAVGNESDYSNEITTTLDSTAPNPPSSFRITVTVNVNITP